MAAPWGATGACLHDLLDEQARSTPDAIALSYEDGSNMTFAELNSRADRISSTLLSLLGGPEAASSSLVGVRLDRHMGAVVAIVGVLKSGAAYVPVDPTHPPQRQQHIIDTSRMHVMLVGKGQSAASRQDLPDVTLVEIGPLGDVLSISQPEGGQCSYGHDETAAAADTPRDRSLAYVLFTSGSTGLPKGVVVEHRGVVNMLAYFRDELGFGPGHTVLGLTTFCFDISVLELFLPLTTGGRVYLVSSTTQKDPQAIHQILESQDITVLQATPATYELLMAVGWRGNPRLNCICAGEAFRLSLLPVVENCESFRNSYGPTEVTVYSTSYTIPKSFLSWTPAPKSVPIGTPLPATPAYILDEQLRRLPPGEPGELWLSGIQVARGYLRRPDLTAERFVADPFSPGDMMYKTGDLVMWDTQPDPHHGTPQLVYLGRIDTQVKINGYRIELGEIESVIQAAHPGVTAAVVTYREDLPPGGHKGLVAYYVPSASQALPSEEELLTVCRAKLPPYMVPRYCVPIRELPLSTSGKVDRKLLPKVTQYTLSAALADVEAAEGDILPQPSSGHVALAMTDVMSDALLTRAQSMGQHHDPDRTKTLADVVAEVISEELGMDDIDEHSDMAASGLDSMGAALLLAKLSARLGGTRIAPSDMYGHTVVRDFALHLQRRILDSQPQLLPLLGLGLIGAEGRPTGTRPSQGLVHRHDGRCGNEPRSPLSRGELKKAPQNKSERLVAFNNALTGMRGVLIVWVVFHHFTPDAVLDPYGLRFNSNTWLFVALSGFTLMLQRLMAPPKQRWTASGFLKSKAIGLFPILYTGILLNLPRYLAVRTRADEAFRTPWWSKTGIFATDYNHWQTYAWDWLLLLTGTQQWVKVVGDRTMPTLYYGSVQWSMYLLFALMTYVGLRPNVRPLLGRLEALCGGPIIAGFLVVALSNIIFALVDTYDPQHLGNNPLVYVAAFVSGMATARVLVHLALDQHGQVVTASGEGPRAPASRIGDLVLAHSSDAISALLMWLILSKWGQGPFDCAMGLQVIPAIFCLMLLLLGLHTFRHSKSRGGPRPLLVRLVYETEVAQALGRLSFAIYLFHEVLGDVYMQMAVKGLFKEWGGMLPPPGTPFWFIWQVFQNPWMSTQSLVLKLATLALAYVVSWIVNHYVTGHALIQSMASVHRVLRWQSGRRIAASAKAAQLLPPSRSPSDSPGSDGSVELVAVVVSSPTADRHGAATGHGLNVNGTRMEAGTKQ